MIGKSLPGFAANAPTRRDITIVRAGPEGRQTSDASAALADFANLSRTRLASRREAGYNGLTRTVARRCLAVSIAPAFPRRDLSSREIDLPSGQEKSDVHSGESPG